MSEEGHVSLIDEPIEGVEIPEGGLTAPEALRPGYKETVDSPEAKAAIAEERAVNRAWSQANGPRAQLTKLAQPFPPDWIESPPPGKFGEYINHAVITQRLLQILGPFDFRIIREIYDSSTGTLTGVVAELKMQVDGREVTIQECGDADGFDKTNGAALKKASSDAFKRCAMRVGVGLELWSKDNYFLWKKLREANNG